MLPVLTKRKAETHFQVVISIFNYLYLIIQSSTFIMTLLIHFIMTLPLMHEMFFGHIHTPPPVACWFLPSPVMSVCTCAWVSDPVSVIRGAWVRGYFQKPEHHWRKCPSFLHEMHLPLQGVVRPLQPLPQTKFCITEFYYITNRQLLV